MYKIRTLIDRFKTNYFDKKKTNIMFIVNLYIKSIG